MLYSPAQSVPAPSNLEQNDKELGTKMRASTWAAPPGALPGRTSLLVRLRV